MINNNKAFTLIELLAVIVILAIILVIAVPQILNVIGQAKEDTYSNQLKLIDEATKLYVVSGQKNLVEGENKILLQELVSNGFIKEIKDNNTTCEGYIIVTKEGDNITYNPYMKCGDNYVTDGYVGPGFVGADIHQETVPSGYTGIYTIEDLDNIRNTLNGKYILMNDLDFNSDSSYANPTNKTTYTTGNGWNPIGTSTTYFTGTIDGNNYVIKNLFIDRSSTTDVGLIGYASTSTFVIEKLGLENVKITGGTDTGSFAGYQSGGTIRNVYATGTVTGTNNYTGGIVGYSVSSIEKVYSNVNLTGTSYVGGITGYVRNLKDSFVLGNINASSNCGYLYRSIAAGTIINNYYNKNITYSGSTPVAYTAISKFPSTIKSEVFYNAVLSWDIENIWDISGDGYPSLGGTLDVENYTSTTSITKIEDLFAMMRNLTGTYTLMNDLDFNDINDYRNENNMLLFISEKGWDPIGGSNVTFDGSLDGNGYKISNLYINRPDEDYIGLFAFVKGNSTKSIQRLNLENVNVIGKTYVGALIGRLENAVPISNITISGDITGTSNVGGLLGYNYGSGTISNSQTSCDVISSAEYVGGLVGYNSSGNITNNYTTGTVTNTKANWINDAGGLLGFLGGGTISNNKSSSNITGDGYSIGGLAGYQNGGTVTNNYTTGTVTSTIASGSTYVGGLIGYQGNGTVTNNYSISNLIGKDYVGGIVGYRTTTQAMTNNFYSGNSITCTGVCGKITGPTFGTGVSNCYYNSSGTLTGSTESKVGIAMSPEEMQDEFFYSVLLGWDIENIWNVSGTYPIFGTTPGGENTTTSTSITKIEDLIGIQKNLAGTYTLMNDLDFNDDNDYYHPEYKQKFIENTGFIPIGEPESGFLGSLDGNGHKISNLYINRPDEDYVGLFSFVKSNSTKSIQRLNLENVNVTGKTYVGALIGRLENAVPISNITISGDLTGTSNVGGLLGYNYGSGTISNSQASCDVTSSAEYVGGLIGYNSSGNVTNSYTTGTVTNTKVNWINDAGGLIGFLASGIISNNKSSSNVTGAGYIMGGLIGYQSGGTITNNYTTGTVTSTMTSSTTYTGGLVGNQTNGTITNNYSISNVIGKDYVGGLVGYRNTTQAMTNNFYSGNSITCTGICGRIIGPNYSGGISDCYYNSSVTVTGATPNALGTSTTSNELQNLTPVGLDTWDKDTIWQINSGLYPTLR